MSRRITDWPFKNMPAVNGAICAVLYIGGLATLLYWLLKWIVLSDG